MSRYTRPGRTLELVLVDKPRKSGGSKFVIIIVACSAQVSINTRQTSNIVQDESTRLSSRDALQ